MNPRIAAAIIAALFSLAFLIGIASAQALPNSYPSITDAQADRDGDFDTSCSLFGGDGGWQTDNIGSDRNGEGEIDQTRVAEGLCSAHLWGTGEHRAEVAFSSISNPQVLVEQLFYVPSSSGHLGFLNQFKQGGSAGGCANGGISNRSGSDLEVTVRASCSADNVRFPIGTYPRDQWWALRFTFRMGNAGMVAASVDVDGPGPLKYVRRLAPTTVDNQTGDSDGVKFRAGSYGDQDVELWSDGYRLDFLSPLVTATAHGWAEPPGFEHLTSAQAARKVNPAVETRPQNEENRNVPTAAQVQGWRAALDPWMTNVPYVRGNYRGTTDEIIQWAARKWGFHPRVLRAVAVKESWWDMDQLGDFNNQTGEYDSICIFQMKRPYTYTTPHIAVPRDNTAFCADYYGAILRYYYDGEATWLNDQERGEDYAAGDLWGSVGAWYAGRWRTPAAESYIRNTQDIFWARTWAQPGF